MKIKIKYTLIIIICLLFTGCSNEKTDKLTVDAMHPPTIDGINDEIKRYIKVSEKISDKKQYVESGYNVVHTACTNYFDALIRAKDNIANINESLSLANVAATTIMGLSSIYPPTIGIVSAVTGFAKGITSSIDKNSLITPYPEEMKTIILDALTLYENSNSLDKITTDEGAKKLVNRYADMCTLAGISGYAKEALSKTVPKKDTATATATTVTEPAVAAGIAAAAAGATPAAVAGSAAGAEAGAAIGAGATPAEAAAVGTTAGIVSGATPAEAAVAAKAGAGAAIGAGAGAAAGAGAGAAAGATAAGATPAEAAAAANAARTAPLPPQSAIITISPNRGD